MATITETFEYFISSIPSALTPYQANDLIYVYQNGASVSVNSGSMLGTYLSPISNSGFHIGTGTSANLSINSTAIYFGNGTSTNTVLNISSLQLLSQPFGGNFIVNTVSLQFSNNAGAATLSSTQLVISDILQYGNTFSANTTTLSIRFGTAVSPNTFLANGTTLSLGNTSINAQMNSSSLVMQTNNAFRSGANSFVNGGNGYTFGINGLLMQWGWVSANSTAKVCTFSSGSGVAFPGNCYSVQATPNTAASPTYVPAVYAINATAFTVITANAGSTNVYWFAIGN